MTVQPQLRICLLPTEKLVPLLVADRDGRFSDAGLDVSIRIVGSAQERDARLLAGDADVALLNLVSVVIRTLEAHRLVTLTLVERSTPDRPMFKLLEAPAGAMTRTSGPRIGVARNTIVHFLADAMVRAAEIEPFEFVDAADIPMRAHDLLAGTLDLAVLAEPVATRCQASGAKVVCDDRVTNAPPPTLCTTRAVMSTRRRDLEHFMAVYFEVCEELNGHEDRTRHELAAFGLPHDPHWPVPSFCVAELPTAAEVADVLRWAAQTRPNEQFDADALARDLRR